MATFFNIDIVTEFEDIVEVEEDAPSPGEELPDASSDNSYCGDGKHGEREDSKVSRKYLNNAGAWELGIGGKEAALEII